MRRPGQLLCAAALWSAALSAQAELLAQHFCDGHVERTAPEQSRLLAFAALARQALQDSGTPVAVISRSGLNLQRFGIRYSHAGFAQPVGNAGAWQVRQLYYACDEGRPRVFDQGLGGFVYGTDKADSGFVSLVLLPGAAGQHLAAAVRDKAVALGLLSGRYSANAYAHGVLHQNCNQWLAEMLAAAWNPAAGEAEPTGPRQRAQAWLQQAGYAPAGVDVGSHWLMAAAPLVPWISLADHPIDDVHALKLKVSLPADIEAFLRRTVPDAQRIELCHRNGRAVLRRGWAPLQQACEPEGDDEAHQLD